MLINKPKNCSLCACKEPFSDFIYAETANFNKIVLAYETSQTKGTKEVGKICQGIRILLPIVLLSFLLLSFVFNLFPDHLGDAYHTTLFRRIFYELRYFFVQIYIFIQIYILIQIYIFIQNVKKKKMLQNRLEW